MAFDNTPNRLDAAFIQRDRANLYYEQINISGSNLIVYLDETGSLTADNVVIWAMKYGIGGGSTLSASWASSSLQAKYATQSLFATQSISASYARTASYFVTSSVTSASFAISASYAPGSSAATYTSSLFGTASWAVSASWSRTSSFATSASYAPSVTATYTSSLFGTASWANSASWAAAPSYTSSLFGTASWAVSASWSPAPSYTSSLFGTASWAISASWAPSLPSESASYAATASYVLVTRAIVLCTAYTPTLDGADAAEIPVPYFTDGVTPISWSVNRLNLRVQLSGSSTSSVNIEKSISTASFDATLLGTLNLNSGSHETFTGSLSTLISGDKVRFNVVTVGTAQNWTVTVECSNK